MRYLSDSNLPYVYKDEVIAASVVLPVLGIVLTALRFYVRGRTKQGISTDDAFLVLAVVFECGMAVVALIGVANHVVGYSAPPAPPGSDEIIQLYYPLVGPNLSQKLEFSFYLLMILTFGCIKLCVLFFYRRVFVVGRNTFNTISWLAVGLCVLWTVGFFLGQVTICSPDIPQYWAGLTAEVPDCGNGLYFLLALAATDLATDVLIFFLPFPLLWHTRLATRKKVTASVVLAIGSMSLVASSFRLYIHVSQYTAGYAHKVDLYLTFTLIYYWTLVEAGIATIAVNLPVLQYYVGVRDLQSVIVSVRSRISLNSLHSPDEAGRAGVRSDRVTQKLKAPALHVRDSSSQDDART